jgi:site-specific DNA-cytosine methylase
MGYAIERPPPMSAGNLNPTMLDLFSGIGGFSLAGRNVGFETVSFCEIEPFCRAVLNKNFPGVPIHEDIRQLNARPFRGTIDVICGGFPCQPFSVSGKRKGEADERFLWPELLRVITECRPTFCLLENVPGIRALAADRVLQELEEAGYTAGAFVVGADDLGATHRRKRVWITAVRNDFSKRGHDENFTGQRERGVSFIGGLPVSFSADMENISERVRVPQGQVRPYGQVEKHIHAQANLDSIGRDGSRPYQPRQAGQPQIQLAGCASLGKYPQPQAQRWCFQTCRAKSLEITNLPEQQVRRSRFLRNGGGSTSGLRNRQEAGGTMFKRNRTGIVAHCDLQPCKRGSESRITLGSSRATWLKPDGGSTSMADADSAGRCEHCGGEPGGEFLPSSQCRCEALADGAGIHGKILLQPGRSLKASPDARRGRDSFPPARNDFRGWAAALSVDASLAPCVEREICTGSHELPARLVRRRRTTRNAILKGLGNSIIPAVAEVFLTWIYQQLQEEA